MSTRIRKRSSGWAEDVLEPRKTPVQERSKLTVDTILVAAAQVFEACGYSSGTTNRIAERAGVSVGTLYQYYPNKEAIAVALLELHITDTAKKLHDWVEHMISKKHGLQEALLDYVRGIMDVHAKRPRLQHILLEETPLPNRLHAMLQEAEQEAIRTIAEFLSICSEVNRKDLVRSGYFIIHTVESLTHRFAAHPDERTICREDFIRELVMMIEAYLSSDYIEKQSHE